MSSISNNFIVEAFEDAVQHRIRSFIIKGERLSLELHPEVFPCMPLSLLLAESLPDLSGKHVVDVGTGTGVIALAAAISGASIVTCTDVNPEAVALSTRNFQRNRRHETCSAKLTDLFPDEGQRFDVIVSNPPNMRCFNQKVRNCLPAEIALAVDGGKEGSAVTVRLIKESLLVLKPCGELIIPVPDWSDIEMIYSALRESGFAWKEIANAKIPYWIPLIYSKTVSENPLVTAASRDKDCGVKIIVAQRN